MLFRTELLLQKSDLCIKHDSKVLLVGSCFSDNIGQILGDFLFDVCINPFGTVYNPISIEQLLLRSVNNTAVAESDLLHNGSAFCHPDFHSSFNNEDKAVCLHSINQKIKEVHQFLQNTDVVIITLGTAWVYEFIAHSKIVANCHKIQSDQFRKKLLSEAEIISSLQGIVKLLKSINQNVKIIFTISPVKHIKDGLVDNMTSKARLISAKHNIINEDELVYYFPAYELVSEDLRDYRFYKDDLIHPNDFAINYIWEKFKNLYIDDKIQQLMMNIGKWNAAANHKIFQSETQSTALFLKKKNEIREEILKKAPYLTSKLKAE